MGSQWIIFFFIVLSLTSYGQWFTVYLDSIFAAWQGYFGRRYHIASCGIFGENEMLEVLRDVNNLSLKLKPFFLRTSLVWSVAFHSPQRKKKKKDMFEHCNEFDCTSP